MSDDLRDAVTLPEIRVVEYDSDWPARFEAERALLAGALRCLSVAVEHVGSTAVPGLAAKPIIDIMVGMEKPDTREDCIRPLESLGYVYCGEAGVPGRLFFRRGNPRSHNVHVVDAGGEVWQRTIIFRDFLRTHPEAARTYEAVKRELAVKYRTDPEAYGPAKVPFVEAILARARDWEQAARP